MTGPRTKRLIPIAVLVLLAVVLWFTLFRDGRGGAGDDLIASGTVEATEARLGFPATGRVEAISVREGDAVEEGAELAFLDRLEMTARLEQAQAHVVSSRALLLELERGFRSEEVSQARAALDAANRRVDDAKQAFDRTKRLLEGGAVSQEAFDRAQVARDVAESERTRAEEQLRLMEAGPRRERIQAQRAQLAQAEAAVHAIEAGLANLTIRAPFDGIVTVKHREPGEIVAGGTPVLTVMAPDDRWVRIYVPENRLGAVGLGASAAITSDTYPDQEYPGEVMYIASEAEFTPKSVQTTEERVRLVYAVKVRITGDSALTLKPGMPADVRIALEHPPS
ncbi:MAG: HlyD family efflux transporter periplasmic adaptor subunit [Gemmatimonadales bacterium]|nr:HlyD family efflux transporter periplasmic adaptor subunit [Gemmatimonadales bacterium]